MELSYLHHAQVVIHSIKINDSILMSSIPMNFIYGQLNSRALA